MQNKLRLVNNVAIDCDDDIFILLVSSLTFTLPGQAGLILGGILYSGSISLDEI